jgi:predicted  nucleic acid-binding Zn-ribbon protein
VYEEIGKLQEQNKCMMADLMEYEADYSKINQLQYDIERVSKHNRDLLAECMTISKSLNLNTLKGSLHRLLSPSNNRFNKYEKAIVNVQRRFKSLQEEVKLHEGKIFVAQTTCLERIAILLI